jgi:hypothetical protein
MLQFTPKQVRRKTRNEECSREHAAFNLACCALKKMAARGFPERPGKSG